LGIRYWVLIRGVGCTANCTAGRWSWRQPARARQGRNEKPGLLGRVFELDQPFFHRWQKLLGIEKLLGFFQRAKSRFGFGGGGATILDGHTYFYCSPDKKSKIKKALSVLSILPYRVYSPCITLWRLNVNGTLRG
jgi:hypothetical protein